MAVNDPGAATHGFCQIELPASINATMRSAASRYIWLVICSIVFLAGAAGVLALVPHSRRSPHRAPIHQAGWRFGWFRGCWLGLGYLGL